MLPLQGSKPHRFHFGRSLVVRDGISPVLNSNASFSQGGRSLRNTGTLADTYRIGFNFTGISGNVLEPLDTLKSPKIAVREGRFGAYSGYGDSTYTATPLGFKWTSPTAGEVQLRVEAGRNGTNDSLLLDCSGLTDRSGNPLLGLEGQPPVMRMVLN